MPEPPPPKPPQPVLVEGSIKITLRFEADVAALARVFPDEYRAAAAERGYGPSERGGVFLWHIVNEHVEVDVLEIPQALWDRSGFGDPDIEFRWTQVNQEQLDQSLGTGG